MSYRPIARRAWMDDYGNVLPSQPSAVVWERDDRPVETGLLDDNGTPLYRTVDREPIGFRIGGRK